MSNNTRRAEFTAGLRALADWFDQHPDMDLPYEVSPGYHSDGVTFTIGVLGDPEDVPARFAAAVKALGGARTKDADDSYMTVTRRFGPGVNVEVWASRNEVCEAVVVGTEKVEVERVTRPAETVTVVEERDIIEWRCAPLLSEVDA